MDMSWSKLADRCQLFTDANKGMLIELLKEAEEELARECEVFEMTISYSTPLQTSLNDGSPADYCILPENFNSVQSIYYNGNRLSPMDESSFALNSDNSINSGTPSFYYIKKNEFGSRLMFDRKPTSGSIRVEYISLIPPYNASKLFTNQRNSTDSFYIQTTLGAELDGLSGDSVDGGWSDTTYDSADYRMAKFTNTGGGYIPDGAIVEILNYHSIAPIIPSQYHKDLCDYAIAIASAKANPELHNKHLSLWMNNIEKIKNEDADKELIHSVRREV